MRASTAAAALALVVVGVGLAPGCKPEPEPEIDLEALQDPETCAECHPTHYREWLGSMHAYAADDPVFRALNARGQRETAGELGDFCVRCHAPAALALDMTVDGLNLDEIPQAYRGVTCWSCHQIEAVEGTHNNPLRLAFDTVMRGALSDALDPEVHDVGRSELLDSREVAASDACGSCHDIVTPAGAHIERTYAEWRDSFYADRDPDQPDEFALYALGCGSCHMRRETGPIADYPGVRGDRSRHAHTFAGVDVAVTEFPDAELGPQLRAEQREAIALNRKVAVCASLCVRETDGGAAEATVWLHNEAAGHSWPSGATPDRRAWVELIARDDADAVTFSSGVVGDDEAIAALDDPHLWLLRDRIFDAAGDEIHTFWAAASYDSNLLPVASEFGAGGHEQTWVSHSYPLASVPSRLDMRLRLRAIGLEILAELVQSGDLDPAIVDAFETFDVPPAALSWTAADAEPSEGEVDYGTCVSSSAGCKSPAI